MFSPNNNYVGSDSPTMKRERKTSRELSKKINNQPNLSGKIHYKLSELSEEPEEIKTPSQKDSLTLHQQHQENHKKLLLEEFDALVQSTKAKKEAEEVEEKLIENKEQREKIQKINTRPPQRILTDEEKR